MWRERLKAVMQEKGYSQSDLIRALDQAGKKVSSAAVSKWFTGRTTRLKADYLVDICNWLGISALWLQTGQGDRSKRDIANTTPALEKMREKLIPIQSYVKAGLPDSSQPIGDEFIYVSGDVPDEAYALYVKGDSMLPEFSEGDLIIVDPTVQAFPGDYVIARIEGEEECTFKKLRYTGYDKGQPIMELVPLNHDYGTIDSRKTPFEVIGKVIEHRTFFRRHRS